MSAAFGQRAVPPPSSVVWPLVRVVFVTPCTKSPYLTFTLRRPDGWGRGVRSEAEGEGERERGCFREAEVQRDFGRSPLSLDPPLSCRNNKTI